MVSMLVVYDNEGYIITQMSGAVREPVGVPHMWVEVPQGKHLKAIDVSTEEHTPILEDLPKSEIEVLKEQLALQEKAILELSMMIGGNNDV